MAERKSAAVSSSQCTDSLACDQPKWAQKISNPAVLATRRSRLLRIMVLRNKALRMSILLRMRILALGRGHSYFRHRAQAPCSRYDFWDRELNEETKISGFADH